MFRQDWIKWATRPKWKEFEELILYIDPAWKSSVKNDYKAAKLWGKRKTQLWQLRAFVRQATIPEMVRWCYDLFEWAQETGIAIKFYMEANFMQEEILKDFKTEGDLRGYQLPILGDKRKKPDKFLRIESSAANWNADLSIMTIARSKTPTCSQGWNRPSHSRKGCGDTTTRPTPTRAQYHCFKSTHGLVVSLRHSAGGTMQKMYHGKKVFQSTCV